MKVIIYTAPNCVYCQMAKDFFSKKGVSYEEKDVSYDQGAFGEMVKKSHQKGVPVIDINNEVFVGFNRNDIEKILKILK
ncbi:MAG: glutaredoxin family protein [Patescibacteria group bacterium]|nr:glutaredoxin family protein [Patescibacteria group bacterium]